MDSATPPSATIPTLQPLLVNTSTPQANVTDYAAWIGLIISLILLAFEIFKYWNDRAKLKITVNYEVYLADEITDSDLNVLGRNTRLWSITLANVGTKKLIISTIFLKKSGSKNWVQIFKDVGGIIKRYSVTPGESHTHIINADSLIPEKFNEIIVKDAIGKSYKHKLN